MVFNNENELKAFLLSKCTAAVAEAQKKVHKVIDDCLIEFYMEYEPEEYLRTGQLLHSLVKTNVTQNGDVITAEVYFDASALGYTKGYKILKNTHRHGILGYANWDSGKVLEIAMEGDYPHGGYLGAGGDGIWDKSMFRLKDILKILERELKAQGIPIKKK